MSARTAEGGPAAACRDRQRPTVYRTLKQEEDAGSVDRYRRTLKQIGAGVTEIGLGEGSICIGVKALLLGRNDADCLVQKAERVSSRAPPELNRSTLLREWLSPFGRCAR